jgi:hypothetical protein
MRSPASKLRGPPACRAKHRRAGSSWHRATARSNRHARCSLTTVVHRPVARIGHVGCVLAWLIIGRLSAMALAGGLLGSALRADLYITALCTSPPATCVAFGNLEAGYSAARAPWPTSGASPPAVQFRRRYGRACLWVGGAGGTESFASPHRAFNGGLCFRMPLHTQTIVTTSPPDSKW